MKDIKVKDAILNGNAVLGIEMGSTRIKAVLIDEDHRPIASGSHSWENKLANGIWTYKLDDVWSGIQDSYSELARDVETKYGVKIIKLKAIGFSAMMHGYLVFDKNDNQLVDFRTWRNTMTEDASMELTELFKFNIPQRWSIAHLYQAICNNENHVQDIAFMTTLAGYVHWKLTGQKVLGVGEASGLFPIDSSINDYDQNMIKLFDGKIADCNFSWKLKDIIPKVLCAGDVAGNLTAEGAKLLDPSGALESGSLLCPPEGDAGTGMVATNSVAERTGNVSAGTSIFAMAVLEKPLSKVYTEIDMVTTPTGKPVAMVHCNNCTSDLDAWVNLFTELNVLTGAEISKSDLYDALYQQALLGEPDCGGVLSYNYFSGEPVTGLDEGRPLLVRMPDSKFSLANFMRAQLFAAMGTLKIGMDILFDKEDVHIDCLLGHGGLFKTKVVGQRLMAAAMNTPVAVMETAGEGGAWGIALLAAFARNKSEGESLETYLANKVFNSYEENRIEQDKQDVEGFKAYIERYKSGLEIERAAVNQLRYI